MPDKDTQFSFVLSAEDREKLHALADRARMSASEWLRHAVRTAHQKGRLPAPSGETRNRSWGPRRW
jgi:hypothetical protein